MSTPNFKNVNASKIFAVELENDFDYDILKDSLQFEFGLKNNRDLIDSDRNYTGSIISILEKEFGKWAVELEIIVRSGYYTGANLDWNVRIIDVVEREVWHFDEIDEVKIPKNVKNWVNNKIKKVENVFEKYSTPLICKGIFSNGEAIYEKVK